MKSLRNFLLISIILYGMMILTGCFNTQSPAEEMFEKLEKVVEIEKTFEEQQGPLVKLEKEEKELYKQIIELNIQDNHQEIVELADEAIGIADKRKEHLEIEKQSMEESKQEFNTVSEIIKKIEEADLKKKASSLYNLMQERYKIHEKLYQSYVDGLNYDIKLYTMLKNEEVKVAQLEHQINAGNTAYEEVLKLNEEFNEKTNLYNKAKLDFYHSAGLSVESDENLS